MKTNWNENDENEDDNDDNNNNNKMCMDVYVNMVSVFNRNSN